MADPGEVDGRAAGDVAGGAAGDAAGGAAGDVAGGAAGGAEGSRPATGRSDGAVSGRARTESFRRLRIISLVLGVLVLFAVLDRTGGSSPGSATQAVSLQGNPMAAPAGALSSSWFCAGATAATPAAAASTATTTTTSTTTVPASAAASSLPVSRPSPYGEADGQLVIVNAGASQAAATITEVSSGGSSVNSSVDVPARGSVTVPESAPGGTGWEGAIVEVDAGQVVVDQSVNGPLGASSSPCATSGSSSWYLLTGQTRVNADEFISLLNPYPSATIVDLSFVTNQGVEQPQNFQGVDVPADGLVSVDLGTYLSRRSAIEATVTARTGSVVAWETEIVTPPLTGAPLVGSAAASKPLADPAWPIAGVTVNLGAPAAATSWVWPDGLAGGGVQEQYVVYNPGSRPARVRLSIGLAGGAAEPLAFSVGAGQVVPVVSEQQARIPAGVAHSATLASVNGVPVVAERTLTASQAANPVAGATGTVNGNGQILGGTVSSRSWVIGSAAADAHHVGQLVVFNPGATTVTVRVSKLSPGAPESLVAGVVTLRPGGRSALGISSTVAGPIQVSATGPVVAEYDIYGTGGSNGVGLSLAAPMSN